MSSGMRELLSDLSPGLSVGIIAGRMMALDREIAVLEKNSVKLCHFDIMDGRFVPMLTVGPIFVKGIQTTMYKDVHLMIENPLDTVAEYAAAGADIITIHPEACRHPHRALQRIGELENIRDAGRGILRGIALNPSTPVESIEPLLDETDMVTLVAVNPGYKGQKFIAPTFDRFRKVKEMLAARYSHVLVCIDGGVTAANFETVAALRPDMVVTGSAIFDSKEPGATITFMQNALKGDLKPDIRD
jgi:ribulose-phosphate 3-epimerase